MDGFAKGSSSFLGNRAHWWQRIQGRFNGASENSPSRVKTADTKKAAPRGAAYLESHVLKVTSDSQRRVKIRCELRYRKALLKWCLLDRSFYCRGVKSERQHLFPILGQRHS